MYTTETSSLVRSVDGDNLNQSLKIYLVSLEINLKRHLFCLIGSFYLHLNLYWVSEFGYFCYFPSLLRELKMLMKVSLRVSLLAEMEIQTGLSKFPFYPTSHITVQFWCCRRFHKLVS